MLEWMNHFIEVEGNKLAEDNPLSVTFSAGPVEVQAEVSAYDSLAMALNALMVSSARSDLSLEAVAQSIAQRITYLWESLVLIEKDIERDEVLMRSAPPFIEDGAVIFCQARLVREAGCTKIHLTRHQQLKGQARRRSFPIMVTHEVFRRLVDDLSTALHEAEGA
jgi:hypothetical protein